jgi:hypothetical protein
MIIDVANTGPVRAGGTPALQHQPRETGSLFQSSQFRKLRRRLEMIKKVKGGYQVVSEKSKKNLGGPYKTKEEAEKRLRQVEYFKHNK